MSFSNRTDEVRSILNIVTHEWWKLKKKWIIQIRLCSQADIICSDDEEDDDKNGESLEEYLVMDKIVGKRFNPLTKQNEYLLKLKDCKPVKNAWKPVSGSKTPDFPLQDSRLYVQKSQNLVPLKKKKDEG